MIRIRIINIVVNNNDEKGHRKNHEQNYSKYDYRSKYNNNYDSLGNSSDKDNKNNINFNSELSEEN